MRSSPGSRDKILFCARDLFYFVGYQSTSVDDILQVTGVAKSNFYYHFRTKDELALAVLDLYVADFRERALGTLSDRSIGPCERLERFCDALVAAQSDRQELGGCPFGNFAAALSVRDGGERTDRFREALCRVFAQLQSELAVCIEEGVRVGAIRTDIAPDALAATAVAAIEGFMLMAKTHRSPLPLLHGLPVLRLLLRVD